jgi:ATP-binding cassette subfamily B protein/subfamily B ATP-binding cassette protein MsbA
VWLLGLHLGNAVLQAGLNFVLIGTGLRGLARVRRAVFDWLLALTPKQLQTHPAGDVIYRATWDTYAFQTLFQQGVFTALSACASVILMIGVMGRLNLRLTVAALMVVPPLLLLMERFGLRMSDRATKAQSAEARLATMVQQALGLLPLIQSHTRESRSAEEFATAAERSLQARLQQHGTEVLYLGLVAALFAAGTTGLVWLGAEEVQHGRLTLGALWVFLAYLTQLYEPLNQLGHLGGTVSQARAGVGRVLELLDEAKAPVTGTLPVPIQIAQGDLVFESVCFSYQSDRRILQDLSLRVPSGASVAVVGPSGAGKSTLLQLVPRFLEPDPNGGRLMLGGADLQTLDRRSLREQVALVWQEPLLIPASIAENIAFGHPNASAAQIEAAARAANADEFIRRQPKGYESLVGEGSVRLSVGEKQRLNLARAFLKDAPILLLDEPTSSLDGASEAAVLAGLQLLRRGRTTLMVAHRLETLRDVDWVAVLVDGRIVEFGSPQTLRHSGGYLARLWEHRS